MPFYKRFGPCQILFKRTLTAIHCDTGRRREHTKSLTPWSRVVVRVDRVGVMNVTRLTLITRWFRGQVPLIMRIGGIVPGQHRGMIAENQWRIQPGRVEISPLIRSCSGIGPTKRFTQPGSGCHVSGTKSLVRPHGHRGFLRTRSYHRTQHNFVMN